MTGTTSLVDKSSFILIHCILISISFTFEHLNLFGFSRLKNFDGYERHFLMNIYFITFRVNIHIDIQPMQLINLNFRMMIGQKMVLVDGIVVDMVMA